MGVSVWGGMCVIGFSPCGIVWMGLFFTRLLFYLFAVLAFVESVLSFE